MQLKIDELNYHIGKWDNEEEQIASYFYDLCRTNKVFGHVSKNLLKKVIMANLHENKGEYKKQNEKKVFESLCSRLKKDIPFILENEKELSTNHLCLYEHRIVTALNFCTKNRNKILNTIYDSTDKYKTDHLLLISNTLRIIEGIIALISVGDDAHAIALMRGLLESVSKLVFLEEHDCKELFVKYNKYNAELQTAKANKNYALLSKEFKKFLAENKIKYDSSKLETLILYEWMKKDDGTVISNGKQLIEYGFNGNNNIIDLYHICNEFVHEDYISVGYDYMSLREMIGDFLFEVLPIIKKILLQNHNI